MVRNKLDASPESCDFSNGKWVYDQSYPLYEYSTCPYLSTVVACRKNGRPDSDYEKWRWKPDACSLPRYMSGFSSLVTRGMSIYSSNMVSLEPIFSCIGCSKISHCWHPEVSFFYACVSFMMLVQCMYQALYNTYIHRFDSLDFLGKMRRKRIMLVGDSIMRNQWESLVCLVQSVVPSARKTVIYNGPTMSFLALVSENKWKATICLSWLLLEL